MKIIEEANRTKTIFSYSLPICNYHVKEFVKWDMEISQPEFVVGKFGRRFIKNPQIGIYIWHENLHGVNSPLYVGSSMELQRRLYQHRSGSLEENLEEFSRKSNSNVWEFVKRRQMDKPVYCNKKNILCDCIPRYVVRYFVCQSPIEYRDLLKWEHDVMRLLNAPLNKELFRHASTR